MLEENPPHKGNHIKVLLLWARRYCDRDVLIRKLQKFTMQNVSLNAAIEEHRNRKSSSMLHQCGVM